MVRDIGCSVDGYNSVLARTLLLGSPPDEFRTIYPIVGEAQAEAIKPERTDKEIHASLSTISRATASEAGRTLTTLYLRAPVE